MQIENITLEIPGLNGTYAFFQTSDSHVRISEKTDENGERPQALIQAIRTAEEAQADGVFLCGDIIDIYTPETRDFVFNLIRNAKTEVFYVLGNHDCCEVQDVDEAHKELAALCFGNLSYWVRDFGEFLLIGLDNSGKVFTSEQIAFLEEQIAAKKPILILLHAPLAVPEIQEPVREMWSGEMGELACPYFLVEKRSQKKFWELVENPDNRIEAIFAGHVHLSNAGEYAPGKKQYTMYPTYTGKIRKVIVTGKNS